ncbi:hypothetical protein MNBD_GAMMA21-86 [hydrothermal vent metagenome]|uniref:Thaumarchaeal output domain-containing protein n=1 Tax=hydrothermal vent metagenome TaxID=652676 RepID=A0A3B1B5Q5_9ZZZZ
MRAPCLISYESVVRPEPELDIIDLKDLLNPVEFTPAYWVVTSNSIDSAQAIIKTLRQHGSPNVYLRPVVLLWTQSIPENAHITGSDIHYRIQQFDQSLIDELNTNFEPINNWIEKLPELLTASDTSISFKVLRFISSRDNSVEPIPSSKRNSGYLYPLLDPFFQKDDGSIYQILSFLNEQNMIAGTFYTRSMSCSQCGCAFLNFRESCPHCNSIDLNIEELVHHFKCAYSGEISEFRVQDRLVCPKCESELRHIGVDYDKPSIIYKCNSCQHNTQAPRITTTCYNCGKSNEPEYQNDRIIMSYTNTSIGINASIYGIENIFTRLLETKLRIFSADSFQDFFETERSRILRYKVSTSTLALIRLLALDNIYVQLGSRARDVFNELTSLFNIILRKSDVLTLRHDSIFMIIMTETDLAQAQIAVDRLQEGITKLFENNLDIDPKTESLLEVISETTEPESILEGFLNDHVH